MSETVSESIPRVNGKLVRIDSAFRFGRPIVSFEYFPPKSEDAEHQLFDTISELHWLRPSYVSVTYGAGGGTRRNTIDVVKRIQNNLHTRAMAHLTCVGHTREELADILDELWESGVRNLLALRGDPPVNGNLPAGELETAADLVRFARERHPFCIAVAGYPETHPKAISREVDLDNLKAKVDEDASFVITQLFFDNDDFFRFRDAVHARGINVPVIAGIMPVLNVSQVKRLVSMCGAKIPGSLLERIESVQEDPQSVLAIGVDHSLNQCRDLLAQGVEGLHFYTLNRSKATMLICLELQDAFVLGE